MQSSPFRKRLAGGAFLKKGPVLLVVTLLQLPLLPLAAQGQPVDSPLLQRLAQKTKIKDTDRVLKRLREGQPKTRVIVRLLDTGQLTSQNVGKGHSAKTIKDLSFRQQRRNEIGDKVDTYLKKFAKEEVDSQASFVYMPGFGAEVSASGLEKLADDPDVVFIEEDLRLEAHLQQGIPLMQATTIRNSYAGTGVSIAICDSGIDYTHPLLGGGSFPNAKVIGGYDTGQEDSDPMDANGHGTACAGIAAGDLGTTADYIGGVAHGAKLYALKITDSATSGSAWTSDIIQAWEWAITHQFDDPANPIMIISTSFGGGRYLTNCDSSQASLASAATNTNIAGISNFVSAGNEGYCDAIGSPACVSPVISVGAVYDAAFGTYYPCVNALSCVTKTAHTGCTTGYYAQDNTSSDKVTSYSNTASFLTLLAPSNQAYTTDISGTGGYSTTNFYSSFGGTSAAAPYAAGAGALLQSAVKASSGSFLSAEELRNRLVTSGDLIADPKAANRTTPRINLQAAFTELDSDGDGVPDLLDDFPTNPNETVDTDGDGVGDNLDNCVQVANADQRDTDNDAIGDACDSTINSANYGSVLGAPHNESRGIHCSSCHTYSLWWKYSPLTTDDPLYQILTNAMCTNCHGTSGPGQQIKAVHSSAAMGMRHRSDLGPWTVQCIDCHAPHSQAQLDWRTENASELYLATGTITGNMTIQGGQTTFTYTSDTIAQEWNNRATWSRKNNSPPTSGLILVEDTAQAKNTFEIMAADATTITVKGGLDPAAAGSSFGIIYGQAIKSHIQTPSSESRAVKFFNPLNPAGGFADHHTPVTGICQVCHANTLYWNAAGTVFDDVSHTGYGQIQCTNCHLPSLGFKPLQ